MKVFTVALLLIYLLTSPGQVLAPETKQPYILREEIPILMYHEIGSPSGPWKKLYVEPDIFAQQLDWLKANGYTTILLKDIYDHWLTQKPLPEKPIVITFDDGYRSVYETVLPLLLARDMKATFFLYPSKFNTPQGLTTNMVSSLAENGMEIGSHTFSHVDLTKLTKNKLKQELIDSKLSLEKIITQKPVDFICYPAGRFNNEVIIEAKKSGYKGAVTTLFGKATFNQDTYQWERIRINYSDGVKGLAKKI